jgi:hypothetical protein
LEYYREWFLKNVWLYLKIMLVFIPRASPSGFLPAKTYNNFSISRIKILQFKFRYCNCPNKRWLKNLARIW